MLLRLPLSEWTPLFNAPRSAVVAFSSRNGPLCWSAAASLASQLAICSFARDRMMDTRCRAGAGGYDGFTPERNAPDRSPRKFCWNLATPSLVACFAISPSLSVARTIQAFDLPSGAIVGRTTLPLGGGPQEVPTTGFVQDTRRVVPSPNCSPGPRSQTVPRHRATTVSSAVIPNRGAAARIASATKDGARWP